MTMVPLLRVLAIVSIACALAGAWGAPQRLSRTTLVPAAHWARTALVVWMLSLGLGVMTPLDARFVDASWYATALLGLCPAISVLGARRPGAGVWNAFVILPLLLVLGWPLLTLWGNGDVRGLRLETPQLVGFVLVLLMGAGNYLGTRYSLPAALCIVSLCLVVGSVSAVAPLAIRGSSDARSLASVGLGVGVLLAVRSTRRPSGTHAGVDRLWADYRDTFGIVWAKRFQDRLNGIALQQQWPARLGEKCIEWQSGEFDRQSIEERIQQTIRWLLRRFVDPEWIDQRLNNHNASSAV